MIWRKLFSKEAVNAHGEFCLCVHETTEDEIRERHAHFNMCVVNKTTCLRHSFTDTQNMQDLYLNIHFVA